MVAGTVSADDLQNPESGDFEAQVRVGISRIIDRDTTTLESGINLLRRANRQANPVVAHQLGVLFLSGRYVPRDVEQAQHYYAAAIWQGDPIALFEYAMHLQASDRTGTNLEESRNLMWRAAELRYAPAVVALVRMLDDSGDPGDAELSLAWNETLDARNRAFGAAAIAVEFELGDIVGKNIEMANDWLRSIPEADLFTALGNVASGFMDSQTVRYAPVFAASLYERVIVGGNPATINNYSWLLSTSRHAEVLDGERAAKMMEACIEEFGETPAWVDTLAAAYAEAGRFEEAVATQRRALELFEVAEDSEVSAARERLELYASGEAYRE